MEAQMRQLSDPAQSEAMVKACRRARKQAEALERAAVMSQGRPRPLEPQVQFVYDLVDAHHDLAHKPAKLRKLDVDGKLGDMPDGRFRGHVADARKLLGLP